MIWHVGAPFSTYDVDNYNGGANCSLPFLGAWWYKDCANITSVSCGSWSFPNCQYANLNGQYGRLYREGVMWNTWSQYALPYAEMKLRPTFG